VAAQRDHGNREIRMNARMKYLVHNLGIDGFRTLVEG
jgi:sulfite reductase (ferredoxin)